MPFLWNILFYSKSLKMSVVTNWFYEHLISCNTQKIYPLGKISVSNWDKHDAQTLKSLKWEVGSIEKYDCEISHKPLYICLDITRVSLLAQMVKNPTAMWETWSIPGLGRSPGGGHGNPLQCSCLENPRDGGAWWATIYGVAQGWTRLKRLSISSSSTPWGNPCFILFSSSLKWGKRSYPPRLWG